MNNEAWLIEIFKHIQTLDQCKIYEARNREIIRAVHWALVTGYQAGFRFDPAEPERPVAFIELPTGQVSWHLAQHPVAWDGHTTEQKHERIAAYRETYSHWGVEPVEESQ